MLVDPVLPTVDPDTQLSDFDVVASHCVCPNCGGPVFLNVRGGDWFVESDRNLEGQKNYELFLERIRDSKEPLVVLSIGAGYNTPSVCS